jgi:hypothetical protein
MSIKNTAPPWQLVLAAALVLAGCAAPPPVPPPNVPPPVSAAPTPAPVSSSGWTWSPRLDSAARSLRDSLSGSGVEVAQTTDQRLWLSLPGAETFPIGRSALTRPAGGWLDQVALALDRAASARDWMVMRGVPARRVAVSGQGPKGKTAIAESRLDILIGERAAR